MEGPIDRWIDGTIPAMPLIKLQTDIDYELVQRLEKHKRETGMSKAAIVTQALREFLERQGPPEPDAALLPFRSETPGGPERVETSYGPMPVHTSSAFSQSQIVLHSGPASVAELYPEGEEDTPAREPREMPKLMETMTSPTLANLTHPALAAEQRLAELKERRNASKSGREIDELTEEINKIEAQMTMNLLNALPGADPAYVAAREAEERSS